MQIEKIPLADTHSFSSFFLDYITGAKALQPFYGLFPSLENFRAQIEQKSSFSLAFRSTLIAALTRQYASLKINDAVTSSINLLGSPNTFTVVTGHQQNILTGPLYFINKIVTAINTCKALRGHYPGVNFVPVYWMASEDHDFEEISYLRLYGKKYVWETRQKGAVGRFNPNDLAPLLSQIPGDVSVFKDAYLKHNSLSDAVRYYVNALFGEQGLLVIDADDQSLKNEFRHVMAEDIFSNVTKRLVDEDTSKIRSLGYDTQVNARDINFFYLDNAIRDRIEKENGSFIIHGQKLGFTEAEIKELIETKSHKFSPNVVLRPLYQETILPNLAYIGGPSELVYWLQLKGVFAHFNVPFPILMPRNFSMILEHHVVREFEKTGLEIKDLFEQKNYLFNHWTLNNSTRELSLDRFIADARAMFEAIKDQAGAIDPSLVQHVAAKGTQTGHLLEVIEKKMLRAEKRRLSDKLRQIGDIKDVLFPNGELQERMDNFLNFYQSNPKFISDLLDCFDPFDFRFHVLLYK